MSAHLRLANPHTDFTRIAELLSLEATEPTSETMLHEEEGFMLPGKMRRRWVMVDEHNVVNGYSVVVRYPSEPADLFHMQAIVDPTHRAQGYGTQLYDETIRFAGEQGAGRVMTEVREHDISSRLFAEKRGFSVTHHVFDSVLNVGIFDETAFAGIVEGIEKNGIRFFTLAETDNRVDAERKLYEINRIAVLDEPGSTGTFPTYENWRKIILEASWYRPESQFIAADGERYVGLAGVYNEAGSDKTMFNGLTGV